MTLADALPHRHPHPDEHAAWREVGRAHLWSAEPDRALEVLAPLHRVRPWDREVQHLMLDALFALGRSESDFPWTLEPVVLRLGPAILEHLHEALRRNRGPATLLDLLLAALETGYPVFSAAELLEALAADRRFRVHRSGLAPEAAVVACAGDRLLGHPCAPSRVPATV
jgi:hypothetical protein